MFLLDHLPHITLATINILFANVYVYRIFSRSFASRNRDIIFRNAHGFPKSLVCIADPSFLRVMEWTSAMLITKSRDRPHTGFDRALWACPVTDPVWRPGSLSCQTVSYCLAKVL